VGKRPNQKSGDGVAVADGRLKIGNYCNETVLFVIPHLTVEIILGTDWLTRNGAVINYVHETIVLKNKILDKVVVLFDKNRLGNTRTDNINILISIQQTKC